MRDLVEKWIGTDAEVKEENMIDGKGNEVLR